VALKDGDVVVVLSMGDINYIGSGDVQAVLSGQYPPLLRQQIVTRNPRATYVPQQTTLQQQNQLYGQQQPGGQQPSGALRSGLPGQQQFQPELQSPYPGQQFPGGGQSGQYGQFGQYPQFGQPQSLLGGQQGIVSGQQELQAGQQALLAGEQPGFAGEQVPLAGEAGTFNAEPEQFPGQQQPSPLAVPLPQSITAANLLALRQTQICRGLQELASIVAASRPGRFANARFTDVSATLGAGRIENVFPCPPIFEKYPELLPLAVEHVAVIQGEVRLPGLYPVVAGVALASAVTDAGGLTRDVDLRRVEITHFAVDSLKGSSESKRELLQLNATDLTRIALSPGDIVRFNPVFTDRDNGPVLLSGEFRRPGFYDIRRGERLSQLIERAGGLTDEAYPYGAVFTRYRVKQQEQRSYLRAASQLESGLTTALSRASGREDAQALVTATQQLVTQIRATPAVGRVVVEADPTVLEVKPQVDPIMEPGDSIFMPKRPFYVAVSGEVLNPTSLQFTPGASPGDYIKQAGGLTQDAEDDSIFIVFPNGQAQPVSTSFWNFTSVKVPPGSTIVVPKDLRPFDLTTFLRDSTQIVSQLAISAASLAVLNNNSTR
jgi:protein involved in polysaccharide export with SLBB domain